ncbi:hypothetical protein KCF3NO3_15590 [Chryseobacterium sp. KCF3-3]
MAVAESTGFHSEVDAESVLSEPVAAVVFPFSQAINNKTAERIVNKFFIII